MNNLTPVFERETGQVILKGPPAGMAGEAPMVPVPGLELAFDRADGRLCRVMVETIGADGPIAFGEQVAAILIMLFGSHAPRVISGAPPWSGEGLRGGIGEETAALSPEPGLTAVLSSLARLTAARSTSPVPPSSPWWAAEAADLAQRAGLAARARAEAHRALAQLLAQPDTLHALPEQGVCVALAVASISAATEPDAARRLREVIEAAIHQGLADRPRRARATARTSVGRRGRGPVPGKGPNASDWPAVAARLQPRTRGALPAGPVAVLGPDHPVRGSARAGYRRRGAGAESGWQRPRPLRGPAGGPVGPPRPGSGGLHPRGQRCGAGRTGPGPG